MKKIFFLLLMFVGYVAISQPDRAKTLFGKDMAGIMQHQKTYTLQIAELMPADMYSYKPTENIRSFAEQLKHISITMNRQTNYFLKKTPVDIGVLVQDLTDYEKKNLTKKEIMKDLSKEFDDAIKRFEAMTEEDLQSNYELPVPGNPGASLRAWCMALRDHITHHRGQAIIYLRMNGIKVPQYLPF